MKRVFGDEEEYDEPITNEEIEIANQTSRKFASLFQSKRLRASPSNEQVSEPTVVEPIVRSSFSYSMSQCKELINNSTNYINRIQGLSVPISSKNVNIVNVVINQSYTFPSTSTFPMYELREETEINGHSLAFDFTKNYNLPLYFDVDCLNCKSGTTCRKSIDARTAKDLFEAFAKVINKELNLPLNKHVQLVYLCKNFDGCGFHIYYNSSFSVSQIAYSFLLDKLSKFLIHNRLSNLKSDSVIYMPLPFSAKVDGKPYRMIYYDIDLPDLVIPDHYLDLSLSFSQFNTTDEFLFMHFDVKSLDSFNDVWSSIMDKEKKIYVSSQQTQFLNDVNPIISSLKTINYTILYCASQSFRLFIENYDQVQCVNFDFKNFDQVPETILKLLAKVGVTVASFLKRTIFHSYKDIGHLISLMAFPKNTFSGAFHVISAILQFLLVNLSREENIQDSVVEMINYIEILTKEMYQDNLKYIFDAYRNYPMYEIEMSTIYDKPEKIFKYITHELQKEIESFEDSNLVSLISLYKSDNDFIEKLIDYCITIGTVNSKVDEPFEYRKMEGIYVELKDRKPLESTIRRSLCKEVKDSFKGFDYAFRRVCMKSVKIDRQFGRYKFFINTEFGIFNTITNTYCSYLPFIFFDKRKRFSYISNSNILTFTPNTYLDNLFEINQENLQSVQYIKDIIRAIETIGNDLVIEAMIVPGLLKLSKLDFYKAEKQIKNTIELICHINIEKNTDMELYDRAFKFYNFDTRMIYSFSYIYYGIEKSGSSIETEIFDLDHVVDLWYKINGSFIEFKTFKLDFNSSAIKQLKENTTVNFEDYHLVYGLLISIFATITQQKFLLQFNFEKQSFDDENRDWLDRNNLVRSKFDKTLFDYSTGKMLDTSIKKLIPFIHKEELMALRVLFTTFNFKMAEVLDFIRLTYTVHQPINKNKSFTLLIGKTGAGKTLLQNILKIPSVNSSFSVAINLNESKGQTNGPQSATIDMMTSYLTLLTEVKSINPCTIKILTGSDSTTLRRLYKDSYGSYYCISTIVGASNDIVRIYDIDEAVRERLAPFNLKVQFTEPAQSMYKNPLWFLLNNKMVKSKICERTVAVGLSNLQYGVLIKDMSHTTCDLTTRIENENSLFLIKKILCKNNIIYNILFQLNIDVGNDIQITKTELMELVEPLLGDMKMFEFIAKFEELFCINCENDIYKGIGLKRDKEQKYIKLKPCPGSFVDKNDLIEKVFELFEHTDSDINTIVTNTINKYSDAFNEAGFVDYALE